MYVISLVEIRSTANFHRHKKSNVRQRVGDTYPYLISIIHMLWCYLYASNNRAWCRLNAFRCVWNKDVNRDIWPIQTQRITQITYILPNRFVDCIPISYQTYSYTSRHIFPPFWFCLRITTIIFYFCRYVIFFISFYIPFIYWSFFFSLIFFVHFCIFHGISRRANRMIAARCISDALIQWML